MAKAKARASDSDSRWRREARRMIEKTLKGLPVGASNADQRHALRQAYPFGERANHPYRMWLAEVRLAIGTRAQPRTDSVRVDPNGEHGPAVVCSHCHGCDCLLCYGYRRTMERLKATTDWTAWRWWLYQAETEAVDLVFWMAFSDWLEENGWGVEAVRVRKEHCR